MNLAKMVRSMYQMQHSAVLEWQKCSVGWSLPILTALLFTGRVYLHLRRNPARVFLRASARPYLHNTATRMPYDGREGLR